ncbi:MAG: hypothetical protein M1835_005978 [Candelina submexicana]|nr:MAG: hypothetical protein M1835_005978 [Candelina submexicana]
MSDLQKIDAWARENNVTIEKCTHYGGGAVSLHRSSSFESQQKHTPTRHRSSSVCSKSADSGEKKGSILEAAKNVLRKGSS